MATIKSSLEIALERAAAIAGDAKPDLALQEAQAQAKALARKFLSADLEPDGLAQGLAAMAPEQREAARREAAGILCDALAQAKPQALPGLEALAQGRGRELEEALQRARAALEDLDSGQDGLMALLMAELSKDLAAKGFSGQALIPNPLAHPELEKRREQVLAGSMAELKAAGEALLAAFA